MGKSPIVKKNCVNNYLNEIKFSYFKCVANLSLVPILKPFWRRLVKWCLTFADCRLQTADFRLQTACSGPQTVDYKRCSLTASRKPPRKRMGMCWQCNPHVYSKMTKEGILRYDHEPISLQWHFFTKNGNEHNNGRSEFTCVWCIITVCSVSAFTVDTQAILQRASVFFRDCLLKGRVPKLAGLPTPWVKEIFILFFSKHKGFSH